MSSNRTSTWKILYCIFPEKEKASYGIDPETNRLGLVYPTTAAQISMTPDNPDISEIKHIGIQKLLTNGITEYEVNLEFPDELCKLNFIELLKTKWLELYNEVKKQIATNKVYNKNLKFVDNKIVEEDVFLTFIVNDANLIAKLLSALEKIATFDDVQKKNIGLLLSEYEDLAETSSKEAKHQHSSSHTYSHHHHTHHGKKH